MRAIVASDTKHRQALGWMRLLAACALCTVLLIALGQRSAGGATIEPVLQFLTAAPLELAATQDGTDITTNVTVRNGGEAITDLTFTAVFSDDKDAPGKHIKGPEALDAYSARTFPLTLTSPQAGKAAKGWIVASSASSKSAPAALAFTITPKPPDQRLDLTIMLAALLLALLSIGGCWWRLFTFLVGHTSPKLTDVLYLEAPAWELKDGWASKLTVIGGILGLIAGPTILPDALKLEFAAAGQYAALAVVFAVLAVLAPLPYALTAGTKAVPPKPDGKSATSSADDNKATVKLVVGYVWALLATTFFTLWSVIGQLALAIALLIEMQRAEVLAFQIVAGLVALIVIIAFALLFFTAPRMVWEQIEQGRTPPAVEPDEPLVRRIATRTQQLFQIQGISQQSNQDEVKQTIEDAVRQELPSKEPSIRRVRLL